MGSTAACSTAAAPGAGWQLLDTPPSELRLEFTLPTGQSFRWRRTGPQEYTGVVQQRVVGSPCSPSLLCGLDRHCYGMSSAL